MIIDGLLTTNHCGADQSGTVAHYEVYHDIVQAKSITKRTLYKVETNLTYILLQIPTQVMNVMNKQWLIITGLLLLKVGLLYGLFVWLVN